MISIAERGTEEEGEGGRRVVGLAWVTEVLVEKGLEERRFRVTGSRS